MTEFLIRPARAFDANGCARIVNEWIDRTPWLPRVRSEAEILRHYHDTVLPKRRVTVAEVDGEVAGFSALIEEEAEVTSLFVDLRGRGIGAALLDALKADRDRLLLWTFALNEDARRFYRREGFVEAGITTTDNDERLPDVQYTWSAK